MVDNEYSMDVYKSVKKKKRWNSNEKYRNVNCFSDYLKI